MFPTFFIAGAQATVPPPAATYEVSGWINPGAEDSLAGWYTIAGTPQVLARSTSLVPAGTHCFFGGPSSYAELLQEIDLGLQTTIPTAYIDAGFIRMRVEWWGGTLLNQEPSDDPGIGLNFLNSSRDVIGVTADWKVPDAIYNVGASTIIGFEPFTTLFDVPAGTRYVEVRLMFARHVGTNCDATFDEVYPYFDYIGP